MEDWFDKLDDYRPIKDEDLKEINNPNVILINEYSKLIGLEFDLNNLNEDFEFEDSIKLIKNEEFEKDGEKITIFKNNNLYLLLKNEIMYITYVYELGSIYLKDKFLTLTGWDYNIVINIKDMSAETFYTR